MIYFLCSYKRKNVKLNHFLPETFATPIYAGHLVVEHSPLDHNY